MQNSIVASILAAAHTLDDVVDQAHSHAESVLEHLGEGADIDIEHGTITMPISKLIDLLQPEDVALPAPEPGHSWEVLTVGAPAPVGAVAAFGLTGDVVTVPRPSSPSILYLVPQVGPYGGE